MEATHHTSGLRTYDLVDLLQDLRSQLRDDLQGLQVVHNLLRLRCAEDDCGCVRVPRDPCECEVRDLATELCGRASLQERS